MRLKPIHVDQSQSESKRAEFIRVHQSLFESILSESTQTNSSRFKPIRVDFTRFEFIQDDLMSCSQHAPRTTTMQLFRPRKQDLRGQKHEYEQYEVVEQNLQVFYLYYFISGLGHKKLQQFLGAGRTQLETEYYKKSWGPSLIVHNPLRGTTAL